MAYLLGVDGGTESIRAIVFDLDGRPKGSHASAYQTQFPNPGWAEQNPDDWWRSMGQATRGALAAGGIAPDQVIAMAIDTTCCSVVAVDAEGKPLRPAMIWMDVRSATEAADVAASGDPALRINGNGRGPVSAEWMIPKSLWMKRHEPELFAAAARICEYQDYINWRLTGRWVASLNNMAVRWHYRSREGGLPLSLIEKLGLSDLEEKWPPVIVRPGDVIDGLRRDAAAHLGLPAGIPVAQGGADAFIGMIGLGVTEPGEMALITGSSHLHLGIVARPVHAPGVWGTYMDAVYPDKPIIEGGQTSTGLVIAWFQRHFASQTTFDALNEAAAKIAPGCEGLLVLDHFQGNRTPYTDAASRGAITGLTLKHTPAHVYRAIVEGICLGTKLIVENFGAAFQAGALSWQAVPPKRPLAANSCRHDPCVAGADRGAGRARARLRHPRSPRRGTLLDHRGRRHAMVRTARTIEPNEANARRYDAFYPQYRHLYAALKEVRETSVSRDPRA